MPEPGSNNLLTVAEVGLLLGVSAATVRRRIAEGELPAFRLGKEGTVLRVRQGDIEEFLSEHRVEA